MLKYLHLKNVGLAPDVRVDWAERLNLIAGDNGLGKSFLLDLAWWALTRTWAGPVALPMAAKKSSVEFAIKGKAAAAKVVTSAFDRAEGNWPLPQARPVMPGIVVYIRIDGGFSVWDPARNYWRTDPGRPAAYHFSADQVWDGLDLNGQRACEGLERDWVGWQEARKPQFDVLEKVLRVLSPPSELLRPGAPRRLFLGEGRDRPTLLIGGHEVPVALASAGIRRALGLAYFLVWAWHEHKIAAQLLKKKPESRFVILFDEPETHLHPRWQRQIVPSVLAALNELRGSSGEAQVLVATHAPLVLASLEPMFDEKVDEMFHLELVEGQAAVRTGAWAKQGDATGWLTSDVFGLSQARSSEAEMVINAAEAFMRGEKHLPKDLKTKKAIHTQLQRLLPADDEFWPRWLVTAKPIALVPDAAPKRTR